MAKGLGYEANKTYDVELGPKFGAAFGSKGGVNFDSVAVGDLGVVRNDFGASLAVLSEAFFLLFSCPLVNLKGGSSLGEPWVDPF